MNDTNEPCILIIVDGLGDRPIATLGGKTPLEAAQTPNLDLLAAAGIYGLVDPIGQGIIPNTHSGAGILLGMPADKAEELKRGPVEAAGAGRELQSGEVALRANFASVKPAFGGFVVTDRRAGRITEGAAELGAVLNQVDLDDGVLAEFRSTDQHRGVVVLSGPDLEAAISDTDPGDEELPAPLLRCHPLEFSAMRTAAKVNALIKKAHSLLQDHPVNIARAAAGKPPANGLITRGAGSRLDIQNIIKQMGLSAALITGCNTVRGLARLFGIDVIEDSRFTATAATDIDAKIHAALETLNSHDLAFIHFKAPDICAHDRKPEAKRKFLERLDKAMAPLMHQSIAVALSADHTTDSNTGLHTADPVPSLFYSPRMGPGLAGIKFGETACRSGTMERQTSGAFLQQVLSFINA
jgi:2,3-bisphosphoglycerate-independent phosphoglycerate mutase